MNRKLMLGIAGFFAILGLALMGAENEAVAGRGCHGGGLFGGCHGGLLARHGGCHGGLLAGLRKSCSGVVAPTCGGAERSCHGGLLARLHARKAARKACCGAPAPACCEPAPAPCCEAPAPAPCCEAPAPAPCCEAPAPAPCCEAPAPAPCCESAPAPATCCGGGEVMSAAPAGETIVEGSVQVVNDGAAPTEAPTPAADVVPEAPAVPQQ